MPLSSQLYFVKARARKKNQAANNMGKTLLPLRLTLNSTEDGGNVFQGEKASVMLGLRGLPGVWENHLTSCPHNWIGHNSFFPEVLYLVRVLLGSRKPCKTEDRDTGRERAFGGWRGTFSITWLTWACIEQLTESTPQSTTFYFWLKMGRE